jgi:hypothetical protein
VGEKFPKPVSSTVRVADGEPGVSDYVAFRISTPIRRAGICGVEPGEAAFLLLVGGAEVQLGLAESA